MANPNDPNNPDYPRDPMEITDPRDDPRYRDEPAFLPTWGWVALVIATIIVFSVIFTWDDGTQQQADFPTTPPAASTTPPAQSPAKQPATNNQ